MEVKFSTGMPNRNAPTTIVTQSPPVPKKILSDGQEIKGLNLNKKRETSFYMILDNYRQSILPFGSLGYILRKFGV